MLGCIVKIYGSIDKIILSCDKAVIMIRFLNFELEVYQASHKNGSHRASIISLR